MLKATFEKFTLTFKKPATTSRGVMLNKDGYLLKIYNLENPSIVGVGECNVLPGLSYDDRTGYEARLQILCDDINHSSNQLPDDLIEWPSIRFALETALLDLQNGGKKWLFDTPFTQGLDYININGLVWMDNYHNMLIQINEKLNSGYKVIKIKVGAIDFNAEIDLLKFIRSQFSKDKVTIRLDANGAFTSTDVLHKLTALAAYDIHSIEQPIKAGNVKMMHDICRNSPIPVALDEELIGHHDYEDCRALIQAIKPAYIVIKPSLIGGFAMTNQWIDICHQFQVGWWITSALESNIGLNAIAQYTASVKRDQMAQGLGTGSLFTNNFESPLYINDGQLRYKS